MKKIIFSAFFVIGSSVCFNVSGQVNPPSVPDNATPQDNTIKMRSVELERVKRQQSTQTEADTFAPVNTKIEAKFPEIKEDFEGIQVAQTAIVAAYTTGKTVDYAAIESNAELVSKKAKRLDSNLFPDASTEKRKEVSKESKEEKSRTLQELIVELDNAVGSFVSSKIFANLKVIEPEVAVSARADLLKIKELSEKLSAEAKKMK
ncbi:MAG TPA: hypothetical protein VIL74_18615 [Pyrinomonadaceae bacterium]|jgi:uncharacterized protein (DUF2384 family)